MSRRPTASAVQLKPDPRYASLLVTKFVNCMMWQGKKSVAQAAFYGAMDIVKGRVKDVSELDVFAQAVENVKPTIEVRSRRVGGATYQVPMQVNKKRQNSLAMRWMIHAARAKKGRPMAQRLAEEIVAAYNREGAAMNQREQVHRMAEANKAFAHFAW
ncbi:MAG: 30S ribosomal protein S7 [Planctomycetes bacterium]|nr:30S ribosomal protein S7 [Planctomycetota bacterium]